MSGGNASFPIQCYRVSVRKSEENALITSQALPSFFLSNINNDNLTVSHLRWVTREDADSLVVGATSNTNNNSILQVWELHEADLPVHHLFAAGADTSPLKTVVSI